MYLISTPWWLRALYPSLIWKGENDTKCVYFTFDDGPHPEVTHFVLDQLFMNGGAATFFCIGKNVQQYPEVYQRIIQDGHTIGNHTQNHLNGWKVDDNTYLENIKEATTNIKSNLFRPPYGRIKRSQIIQITQNPDLPSKIVMWSVLSGDFDKRISPQKCYDNVFNNTKSGDIIVFHDSEKAFKNLQYALPKLLEYYTSHGYVVRAM